MTQLAVPDAVKAPFQGEEFDVGGEVVRLTRRGDEFWAELFRAARGTGEGRTKLDETRIVMTTGSHHMQGFWLSRRGGNLLDQLPLMWLVGSDETPGRWIPVGDSFLRPPRKCFRDPWNATCIFCHSVGGKPRLDFRNQVADTQVVELGIACEACHGPARRHIENHQGDVALRLAGDIVQPGRLEPRRSAAVCGQCHSVMYANPALVKAWNESGTRFRPGDALEKTRTTVSPSQLSADELQTFKVENAESWESRFWPDGMVRTVGRDYNGLLESACYQQGGMTCLSCHSMHHSDPNDQLAKDMQTNDACYQCHVSYRDSLTAHTHHTAGSSGSLCYNCHMPHTTYGLFKAVRSHQISSPSVATTIETGRPSACSLCHLDRPSLWVAARLTQWYGQRPVDLKEDQKMISEAALFLLRGDAAQRAIVAWAFGWPEAKEAAGDDWKPPLLAPLLDDPYSAVRLIAQRSLRRLGYDIEYDFLGPSRDRTVACDAVLDRWRNLLATQQGVSIDPATSLDQTVILRLLSERDDRPISIAE